MSDSDGGWQAQVNTHDAVAQAIWQTYAADTGRSLPAGEADRLADAALHALAYIGES